MANQTECPLLLRQDGRMELYVHTAELSLLLFLCSHKCNGYFAPWQEKSAPSVILTKSHVNALSAYKYSKPSFRPSLDQHDLRKPSGT